MDFYLHSSAPTTHCAAEQLHLSEQGRLPLPAQSSGWERFYAGEKSDSSFSG